MIRGRKEKRDWGHSYTSSSMIGDLDSMCSEKYLHLLVSFWLSFLPLGNLGIPVNIKGATKSYYHATTQIQILLVPDSTNLLECLPEKKKQVL